MVRKHTKRADLIKMNVSLRKLREIVTANAKTKIQRFRYRLKGFRAIGDPLRIYYVDPNDITRGIPTSNLSFDPPTFGIKSGNWDEKTVGVEDPGTTHSMFVKHFEQDIPWKETETYKKVIKEIDRTGGAGAIDTKNNTVEDWDAYLEYLDNLYESIKKDGFKRQTELTHEDDFTGRAAHPALNEVQLFVGRDGDLIIKAGLHRLSIAKILDIEEIPVRTQVRHYNWQVKRENILRLEEIPEEYKSHPEIQDII